MRKLITMLLVATILIFGSISPAYADSQNNTKTGWVLDVGVWFYINADGTKATNQWIGGKYYVDSDGIMLVNKWTPDGYYVGNNGQWIPDYRPTTENINNSSEFETQYKTYTINKGGFINISVIDNGYKVDYGKADNENIISLATCSDDRKYGVSGKEIGETLLTLVSTTGETTTCKIIVVDYLDMVDVYNLQFFDDVALDVIAETNRYRNANGSSTLSHNPTGDLIAKAQIITAHRQYEREDNYPLLMHNFIQNSYGSAGYVDDAMAFYRNKYGTSVVTIVPPSANTAINSVLAWANDPPHRANMLDKSSTQSGSAVAVSGYGLSVMITYDFDLDSIDDYQK